MRRSLRFIVAFRVFTYWALPALALIGSHPLMGQESACSAITAEAKAAGVIHVESIAKWSFSAGNFKAKADQLLPPGFISEIEAVKGPLVTIVTNDKGRIGIRIETKNAELVAKVALYSDAEHPDALLVEELRLQNPLDTTSKDQLKASQAKKGIPLTAFKYARDQVLEITAAGGYKRIRTGGAQNFSVFMLYRKMVGMEPETPISREYTDLVDKYYSFARKELPDGLRVGSVQEFTEILGDFNEAHNSGAMQALWTGYKSWETSTSKVLPKEVKVYKNKEDLPSSLVYRGGTSQQIIMQLVRDGQKNVVAVVFDPGKPQQKLSFVDTVTPGKPLFEWSTIARKHLMSLASHPQ